jgi:hypothetical protein
MLIARSGEKADEPVEEPEPALHAAGPGLGTRVLRAATGRRGGLDGEGSRS